MGSRMEGGGGIGSVFFQFFYWDRMLSKKKKKLFSNNRLLLPSVSKIFGGDEKMPKSKHFKIADKNIEDSSISQNQNSVNKKMRDPGPVARLMGLESMPIVQHKKPSKSSLALEFGCNMYETSEVKESRPQKLQRTGGLMERQQQPVCSSEGLLSNRRTRRQYHHKLASPVKSPRLLSKRRTTRLMEAATRILEPGWQSRRNHVKCALTYEDISQSDNKTLKNGVTTERCMLSLNDSAAGPSGRFSSLKEAMDIELRDEDNAMKDYSHEESKMEQLESTTFASSSHPKTDAKRFSDVPINNNTRILVDVEAKFNAGSKAHDLYEKKNCMRDQYNRKNFRQNQMPPAIGKLSYRSGTQSARRDIVSPDSCPNSCTRSRTVMKELHREKVETTRNELERKNKAPKRRSNDDSLRETGKVALAFEKRQSKRSDLINRKGKGIGSSRTISCSSTKTQIKNSVVRNDASGLGGNGIISFTFSSPMRHASRSYPNEEKADKRRNTGKSNSKVSRPGKLASTGNIQSVESEREETVREDSLSKLLEQKIEELSSLNLNEPGTRESQDGRSTAFILGELSSVLKPCQESTSCSGSTDITGPAILYHGMDKATGKFQDEPETRISSTYHAIGDLPSPMSILDVSFSIDSCFSGSPHGSSGYKPDFGSGSVGGCNNIQSSDLDSDLLDSASSSVHKESDMEKIPNFLDKRFFFEDTISVSDIWFSDSKLSYPTEAKSNAKLLIENITSPESNGKDSVVFYALDAIEKTLDVADTKDGSQFRRLLFDCMIECIDSQHNFLRSRSNLSLPMRRERLAAVICKEIKEWYCSAGKAMDDIVENDMRSSKLIWTKFETESSNTVVQIENCILNELIHEMVIDLCI